VIDAGNKGPLMQPRVIDNFLPADLYDKLRKYVQSQPMKYGSKSNSQTDPHGHWSWKPTIDNRHNLADLTYLLSPPLSGVWNVIRNTHTGPALVRCYANGYTYGTDGYFHTDSVRQDEQTVIIFICDKWEPDWAGETHWYSQAGHQNSASPWPNRALILPSNLMHCARAVSRKCTSLRLTLMYKVRNKRSDNFEKLSSFLVKHGALDHKHKDGSLHDHLVRVYQLLEDKKLPPEVCFGGGLHSIYGTNIYEGQMFDPSNPQSRATVADTFGKHAEALAFLFSSIDRPQSLETDGYQNLKLRYEHSVPVTPEVRHHLQLIEAANLLDQKSLDKWPNLKKVWDGQTQEGGL
jgi:SM-20-related protein